MKENKKVILVIVGVMIAISLIGTAVYYSFFSDTKYRSNGDNVVIGDINQPVKDSKDEGRELQSEIKELNSKYSDAKAWVKLPGTAMDYPVFQATDNDRYLRNNRDNIPTKWGENFMDYRCDIDNMKSQHIIVYGHNTETNDSFSPLVNYKNKEFYNTHKYIEFATLNGKYKFEIFSTYTADANFDYLQTEFSNGDEYKQFLKTIKNKSSYTTGIEISQNDTILTLSTCDYTQRSGRYVVHAKLVK
ncbi:MAG: class B sortase [Clostridia bacterium]